MSELIPTITWSQNNEYTIINLVINQAKNDVYEINSDNIVFSGISNTGVKYGINLNLFNEINKDESKYILEERNVRFILKKIDDTKWIRITKDKNQYKSNIKVNWDNFEDSDEENEAQGQEQFDYSSMMNMQNMMNNGMGQGGMEEMMKSMNLDNNEEYEGEDDGDDEDLNEDENLDNELDNELDNILNNNDNDQCDEICNECS